jgi:hypothetical protein
MLYHTGVCGTRHHLNTMLSLTSYGMALMTFKDIPAMQVHGGCHLLPAGDRSPGNQDKKETHPQTYHIYRSVQRSALEASSCRGEPLLEPMPSKRSCLGLHEDHASSYSTVQMRLELRSISCSMSIAAQVTRPVHVAHGGCDQALHAWPGMLGLRLRVPEAAVQSLRREGADTVVHHLRTAGQPAPEARGA